MNTTMDTTLADNDSLSYSTLMNSHVFVLDCWLVYPTRNLIEHKFNADDSRLLEPRLMRLLCLLAASADAVVAREDIITVLWPRVVVNENSLTRAVSDLRRALTAAGDKRSALIQTIPKRGYRLTLPPVVSGPPARPVSTGPANAGNSTTRHWARRWTPSFAAGFILALALAVRVGDDGQRTPLVAQLPTSATATEVGRQQPLPHYDRVIGKSAASTTAQEAEAMPAGLFRDNDTSYPIARLGNAPSWQNTPATMPGMTQPGLEEKSGVGKLQGQSMLTPDGQLLAYVDYHEGIASLNLRPVMAEAEPWVAFTTDERIFQLQWSPLDAGILLTVGQTAVDTDTASYLRLMLLDLETLTVQELYRRELPAEQARTQGIGNLT